MLKRFFGRKGAARSDEARRDAPGRAQEKDFDWKSLDAVAESYERVIAPQALVVGRDLLQIADIAAGTRVLEIGAGTGAVVESAAALVDNTGIAVGVDSAIVMLRTGRKTRPGIVLVAGQALDLPFFHEMFDLVVANFTLPRFRQLDTALFDILRVVKPAGRFAASVWTGPEDEFTRTWRAAVEEAVGKEVLRGGLKDEAPWTESLADRKRFEEVLRRAGLRPVRIEAKQYRFNLSRESYIEAMETEASGRFVRSMLGPRLWTGFRERIRVSFAERFPEHLVDIRDALLAIGTKPR